MLDLAGKYRANKQSATAACFRDAASALDRFTNHKPITFAGLTATKLEELERYLRDEGCNNGGIGVYMRMIRIAVNRAIKSGLMDKEQYPFDTVRTPGYSMKRLKSTFSPRALSEVDLDKVKAFPFEDQPALGDTVRLFLFSYYARGMNFRDMALLKPANLVEGRLKYTRMKTKAKGKAAIFDLEILPQMAEVMHHFHDAESPWIFPILRSHHTDENAIWSRTKDALRLANRHLKLVAGMLDINGDFTFYVARHSYAMNRKRSGISIGKLSESMGHASEAITHAYLKSFSNEELDAANQGL
jgi:integrase/recombinase XerD